MLPLRDCNTVPDELFSASSSDPVVVCSRPSVTPAVHLNQKAMLYGGASVTGIVMSWLDAATVWTALSVPPSTPVTASVGVLT
jgi:acyl-CoA hydrolase